MKKLLLTLTALGMLSTPMLAQAQELDLGLLSKKAANPIGDMWLLWTQHDTIWYEGDALDDNQYEVQHVTSFRPLLSFPVQDGDYNLVIRPAVQFISNPINDDVGGLIGVQPGKIQSDPSAAAIAADPFNGRTNGLGDSVLMGLYGPNRDDGLIWAVGATTLWPTASDEVLGAEKFGVGPAALIAKLGKKPGDWNFGLLPQHWESYAGDDNREDVSLTDIQYFINYKLNKTDLLGMSPNIKINWEADSDNRYTVPVGLGYNTMRVWGGKAYRLGIEAQYNVIKPDSVGQDFGIRLYFIPIVANPYK